MTLLVDTSVWSLAFRRDTRQDAPEVVAFGGPCVAMRSSSPQD